MTAVLELRDRHSSSMCGCLIGQCRSRQSTPFRTCSPGSRSGRPEPRRCVVPCRRWVYSQFEGQGLLPNLHGLLYDLPAARIDPHDYPADVLQRIAQYSVSQVGQLTPWRYPLHEPATPLKSAAQLPVTIPAIESARGTMWGAGIKQWHGERRAVMASTLQLVSSAFEHGASIPRRFTCQGADRSPPLSWSGVPDLAQSLALIVDDPDAPDPGSPQMTWVHWILYNLPSNSGGLVEGVAAAALPVGTLQGKNDWKRIGYGGPCPPVGRHRYFHKLYALDVVLPDLRQPTKDQLLKSIKGHILAQAELIGNYEKEHS
jgi:Raf kinase inhibitor-like YbhB/YbcL family protein